MNPHYAAVADRAGHRCEYCRAPESVFNFPFEVEHVMPKSRGGTTDQANLCLSCRACNLRKSDHLVCRDDVTESEVALFNPRAQLWAEHFRLNHESGGIVGLTTVGRATIACLNLNASLQLAARHYWIRLRMFP